MQITSIYNDSGSRIQTNHIITSKQEEDILRIYRPTYVVHLDSNGKFIYNMEIMEYSSSNPNEMHVWISFRINNQEPNTILRNINISPLCKIDDVYYQKEEIGFLHTVPREHRQSIEVKLSDTVYELG